MIIATVVMAIATVGLFFCAATNIILAVVIHKDSKKYQEEFKDLIQALAISNIVSTGHPGTSAYETTLKDFKKLYKEKDDRKIFKK